MSKEIIEPQENLRDGILFYRSFLNAGKSIKNEKERLKFYEAIFEFGLNNVENSLNGTCLGMFSLVKPQLLANNKKYENGKKGGKKPEPKPNQSETKTEPKPNQSETKTEAKEKEKEESIKEKENTKEKENEKDIIIPETEVSVDEKIADEILKKEKSQFEKIVKIWFDFHLAKFKFEPAFKAIDGSKIKSIIAKLQKFSKDAGYEFSETIATQSFLKFLTIAYSDDWLRSNFELSNLDSKFNSIIQKSQSVTKQSNNDKLRAEILNGN